MTRARVSASDPSSSPSSAELYRRLVDSVSDYAIFALDPNGHVMSWNPGAERLKGYRRQEIIGRSFGLFYPSSDVEAGKPQQELSIAARDGRLEVEGWRVRQDGSRFWASIVISAIRDEQAALLGFAKITRDFTAHREAQESLRQSEERFRLLIQGVQDYAILMLDPQGHVVSWNEGAQRIKGYSAEEIVGRSFMNFYPDEAVARGFPQSELEAAARDGRFEDEGWRVRKDGSHFWANVVITAMRDPEGRLIGFAKITRDLTVRRQAEEQALRLAAERAAHTEAASRSEELQQLNARLATTNRELEAALIDTSSARDAAQRSATAAQEAYRELDQFAYVASHDLKAPLRGIANLAQWIQDDLGEGLSAESTEHMRLLQGRVRRMEALINGILAYSRAGRARAHPEWVDTGSLVRDAIELQAHPSDVKIQVAPDLPTVQAERVPLQQVFMNLLANAVKYARAYRPDVLVTIEWRDLGDAFEFTVADNGPGIASEYHERIWAMFQTLAPRDQVEGTGIGLSVVKKIVEKMGGRVSVESAPGDGATFRFVWPKLQSQGSADERS